MFLAMRYSIPSPFSGATPMVIGRLHDSIRRLVFTVSDSDKIHDGRNAVPRDNGGSTAQSV